MILNNIEINDFRCFSSFRCEFTPGVNVVIGRNGAGKTTLIHAINKALSFIFSNSRSLGKDFLSQGNNTLNIRSFKEGDYRFDPVKREPALDASIKAEAVYNATPLSWKLYRRNQTNATLYQRYYKDAFNKFMQEWKGNNAPLPLLAYYSDSYPHKNVKTMDYALKIINNGVMPRNFGYYQWDDEAACTSIWETRFCNCLNRIQPYYTPMMRVKSAKMELEEKYDAEELKNNEEYQKLCEEEERIEKVTDKPFEELGYVQKYLYTFASLLPGIKGQPHDIDFFGVSQSDSGFQLTVYFKNGDFSHLQDLPAGYRRLYSIVFDMAYRSYILNETTEPEGVVVIDEIDLHLHPDLENEVVNALHKTFPRVQFIMSTHSPAVLTNLHTEYGESQILRMEEGYEQPKVIKDVYGLDYNTGLEDVMGVEARDAELYNLLDSLAYYENKGLSKQANNVRTLLLGKLNGNENRLNEMLGKRRKEMGDEIHQ